MSFCFIGLDIVAVPCIWPDLEAMDIRIPHSLAGQSPPHRQDGDNIYCTGECEMSHFVCYIILFFVRYKTVI
jgi:hypothetical protein